VRVVEAVGRVAHSGDAKRDEDLPAVPRPEPPAKAHTTQKEKSKLRQVRQSAEHLAVRAQPKKSLTHLADTSMAAGGGRGGLARASEGANPAARSGLAWLGEVGGSRRHGRTKERVGGGDLVESPRHTNSLG
jgi:hypothetical protein